MNCEIICVGTEILLGNIVNTNSAYLSAKLSELGINLYYHTVVGDNEKRLLDSIKLAAKRSEIIILTGGLGPTYDDITKETVAKAFDKKLFLHNPSLEAIKEYFKKSNREMTDNNVKQAYIIEGATVFPNNNGTAPGMVFEAKESGKSVTVAILPGPPSEMKPMFESCLKPYLANKSDTIFVSHTVRIFGIGESKIESELRKLMESSTEPTIAPYAKTGECELRITSASKSIAEADEKIMPVVNMIAEKYGKNAYGVDVPNLETALFNKLIEQNKTISFAESCTGGLLAKRITDISGSSAVLKFSAVTYCDEAKKRFLGVSDDVINKHGTVSAECAAEMARGIAKASDADIGISTTGVAGPSTSEGKPVGLVYIGICEKGKEPKAYELRLAKSKTPTREYIREMAASNALYLALTTI